MAQSEPGTRAAVAAQTTPVRAAAGSFREDYRIIVDSIGAAGARMVGVLRKVLPLSESRLAALLYQAPAELIGGLAREQAEQISSVLCAAGLDSRVLGHGERFTPGDASFEVALAIKDTGHMAAVAQLIMEVLGVGMDKARAILCTSPTVLIGHISANTVEALRRRFAALGVELDVSRPASASFDVFLGECSVPERERVKQLLRDLQITLCSNGDEVQPLLAVGLPKAQADKLWDRLRRTSLPVRLVNRDFERFDLRLDQAPQTPAVIEFLVTTTGMPERIARKVLEKTPIVIHQNIPFSTMAEYLEAITGLDGKASGHLLAFQAFSLIVDQVGDATATSRLLQVLGGLSQEEALAAIGSEPVMAGTMTNPQVRWLQQELKRVGTDSRIVSR